MRRLRSCSRILFATFACVLFCGGCSHKADTESCRIASPAQGQRAPLPVLASVTYVVLDDQGLTNDDLRDLELIPNLRAIVLGSPMDDKSVAILASLPRLPQTLERLDLIGPQFTNESLKSIAAFKKLRSLDLDCTSVDDAGIATLPSTGLKLRQLNLYGCEGVTDKAIPHLKELEDLKEMSVQETEISRDGTIRLIDALPGAWVGNSYGLPSAQPKPVPFYVPPENAATNAPGSR